MRILKTLFVQPKEKDIYIEMLRTVAVFVEQFYHPTSCPHRLSDVLICLVSMSRVEFETVIDLKCIFSLHYFMPTLLL